MNTPLHMHVITSALRQTSPKFYSQHWASRIHLKQALSVPTFWCPMWSKWDGPVVRGIVCTSLLKQQDHLCISQFFGKNAFLNKVCHFLSHWLSQHLCCPLQHHVVSIDHVIFGFIFLKIFSVFSWVGVSKFSNCGLPCSLLQWVNTCWGCLHLSPLLQKKRIYSVLQQFQLHFLLSLLWLSVSWFICQWWYFTFWY